MSCCRKCRGSSRQVQGNLQTLENIGGCPVETVCGCQDTSQDTTTTNGSSTGSSSSCGCCQQNCCSWNNNCQRTSVTCRSPSPSMNCDDPDVPIVCCGPTNSVDFDSECGCSNSCDCDCDCDCDCGCGNGCNCDCGCGCGCSDGCGCNCGCNHDCGCQNSCGCTDARKFRVCCDECGCCRKYPCQWRNPFWPEFAKPRWLCCKDLYNVRG
ncbi:MAG TPA: hypothetical protein IAC82_07350 [Candidatus Merdivicinus intestinigallinarum]|nr:hypothetical protein [Candidatus Merdivicinus intestinigallinarum]